LQMRCGQAAEVAAVCPANFLRVTGRAGLVHADRREIMLARKVESQVPVCHQSKLPPVHPVDRPDNIQRPHLFAYGFGKVFDMDLADIDDPVGRLR
jgi:hypothetical protein